MQTTWLSSKRPIGAYWPWRPRRSGIRFARWRGLGGGAKKQAASGGDDGNGGYGGAAEARGPSFLVQALKLEGRLIRRVENLEVELCGNISGPRDFSLSSFGRRRAKLKQVRGSAAFDLETTLSNEAIKALDDEIDGIAKGRAPTAAKRKRAKMVGPAADLSAESSSSSPSSVLAGWLPGFLGGSSSSGVDWGWA